MSALRRKAIRKAIAAILKNKTDAKEKVFSNQTTPSWVEDLPVILVYTRSEDVEVFNEAPREWKRVTNFVVEVIAVGPEEPNQEDVSSGNCKFLSDILDDIAHQVECELSRDDTLGGNADDINLSSTEFAFEGEGSQPLGSVRLIYAVTYYTDAPASIDKQQGVSDFEGANVDWKVGHDKNEDGNESPDNIVEANDVVDIP